VGSQTVFISCWSPGSLLFTCRRFTGQEPVLWSIKLCDADNWFISKTARCDYTLYYPDDMQEVFAEGVHWERL